MNPIVAKKINVNGEVEDVMVGAGDEVDLQIIRSHVGGPVDLGLTGYRDGVRLEFAVGEFSLVDTTSMMNPVASGLLGRVCCGTMMVWAVDDSGAALSYPGDVLVEGASGPAGGPSGFTDPLAVADDVPGHLDQETAYEYVLNVTGYTDPLETTSALTPGSFYRNLINTAMVADQVNLAKLALGFPTVIHAVKAYKERGLATLLRELEAERNREGF